MDNQAGGKTMPEDSQQLRVLDLFSGIRSAASH